MALSTIPKDSIAADAIDGTKIADDAISEEHLDATAITGHTALAESPADTDEFLISDGGTLKRLDAQYVGGAVHVQVGTVHYESSQSTHAATLSNCFSNTYDHYVLYLYILPATNAVSIEMDFLNDSGGN